MDKPCTLLVHFDKGSAAMANEIKADLEGQRRRRQGGGHEARRHAPPQRRDPAHPCQNLHNNLQHPNEYIRSAPWRTHVEEVEVAGRAPSEAPMAWRWIWGRWGFTSPRECKPEQGDRRSSGGGAETWPRRASPRVVLSLSLLPQICLRCFLAADCSAGASQGDALYAAMASGGGAVREVGSRAELDAAVGGARPAAVHFWASWCEASKQMDEVFAHLAVDFPHALFLRVEAEEQPEISEAYGVSAVPYFVFCKEGKTVDTLEGANPASLANKVAKLAGPANVAESAAPASLGVAAGPAVLEKVQQLAQQNGSSAAESATALNKRLEQLVNSHPVILFMKGNPDEPRCGFSRRVVDILKQEGVDFGSFDILGDNEVREGMKKFSNWPTFPQLYCKGELLGGCDIVIAMHESGELKDVLKEHNIPLRPQGSKIEEPVISESTGEKSPEPIGLTEAQKARLESLTNSNPVMIFIKGSPEEPKCGFSGKVIHILKQEKIPFSSFDILSDDEVRQGLKVLSNWPSYPQVYIKGELVGGSDIVMEMHKSGELKKVLSEKGIIPKDSLEDRLKALISSSPVMLFMKGNPDAPLCGFSSKVVNALRGAGVSFGSFDILSDEEVRQGLKTYSNWPTFPQLYYKSELMGGCDIVLEMEKSGELKSTLSE